MMTSFLATIPGAPVQAVRLVRDAGVEETANSVFGLPAAWIWFAMAGAIALGAVILGRFLWLRHREDPAARALRRINGFLRLTRPERQLLGAISRPTGAAPSPPPVALLLSQEAFIRAASLFATSHKGTSTELSIAALQRKIFESAAA